MSKIALSGNASGTGTFSIVAPNSNTDRTLTLPDEAGTVLTSVSTVSSLTAVTDGTSAASGEIGEYITAASSITAANDVWDAITSITLPAGDWEVTAIVQYWGVGGGTLLRANLHETENSSSTAYMPYFFGDSTCNSSTGSGGRVVLNGRINTTTSITRYLNARLTTSASSTVYGFIKARRVR